MNKFNWKTFISIGLFISFFIIFISGIFLYLVPPGRVANWIDWRLILTKGQWEDLHTVFSYFFVILSVFHLFSINWKVFLSYIKGKNRQTKEFWLASLFSLFLLLFTLFQIPPVNYVMDFGSYLSSTWKTEQNTAPLFNAEKYSLDELVIYLPHLNIDTIQQRLKENNLKFENTQQTLQELGEINQLAPIEIYHIIQ